MSTLTLSSLEFGELHCTFIFGWTDVISGCRDTVDSVGIFPKRLPFTASNTTVKTFRHAVSLDERRAKFKANLWNRPTDEEVHLGLPDPDNHSVGPIVPPLAKEATIDSDEVSLLFGDDKKRKEKTGGQPTKSRRGRGMTLGIRTVNSDDRLLNAYERIYSEKNERMTDIEEVWFAGCHCGMPFSFTREYISLNYL